MSNPYNRNKTKKKKYNTQESSMNTTWTKLAENRKKVFLVQKFMIKTFIYN